MLRSVGRGGSRYDAVLLDFVRLSGFRKRAVRLVVCWVRVMVLHPGQNDPNVRAVLSRPQIEYPGNAPKLGTDAVVAPRGLDQLVKRPRSRSPGITAV
jgi:hypothetical protein